MIALQCCLFGSRCRYEFAHIFHRSAVAVHDRDRVVNRDARDLAKNAPVCVPPTFHSRSTKGTFGDNGRQQNEVFKTQEVLYIQCISWFLTVCDGLVKWCRGEDLNLHGYFS